jgi:hypothetical protein
MTNVTWIDIRSHSHYRNGRCDAQEAGALEGDLRLVQRITLYPEGTWDASR